MLFAFYFWEGHGHINPAVSMANALKKRGHDTVLICINDIGYTDQRVVCLKTLKEQKEKRDKREVSKSEGSANPEKFVVEISQSDKNVAEKMKDLSLGTDPFNAIFDLLEKAAPQFEEQFQWDDILRETIVELKPDVIIVDHANVVPAIMSPVYKQKWVAVNSTNPLTVYGPLYPDLFPAYFLGVPVSGITDDERKLSWKQLEICFASMDRVKVQKAKEAQVDLVPKALMPFSPYLNLYIYPRALDYDIELGRPLENWTRIQSLNRPKQYQELLFERNNTTTKTLLSKLDIPQELREFILSDQDESSQAKNKLIFMSLGTVACMDIRMMKRLVNLLADTPYRVIVSKGPRHKEFDLPKNMWGDSHVPQKEILLLVDLVITHGGNNTITECLYSGVPGIIVCPMFGDQFDNAVRMVEKRLGARVDLDNSDNSDRLLLESIERVLQDQVMRDNIKSVSNELRQPGDGPEKAAELLEKLALI